MENTFFEQHSMEVLKQIKPIFIVGFLLDKFFGNSLFIVYAEKVLLGIMGVIMSSLIRVGESAIRDWYQFLMDTKKEVLIAERKKKPPELTFFKAFHVNFYEKKFIWGYQVQLRDLREKIPENTYTLTEVSEKLKVYFKIQIKDDFLKICLITVLNLR